MTNDSFQHKRAFNFLEIYDLPHRPRKTGVVEIRGPLYTSVSYGYLKNLLDDWSYYFDGYKFAGGAQRLLSRATVRNIIRTCHDHGVYVSTGGMVERVIVQGAKAVDQYIDECKSLGFDVIEVSSGLAPIPLRDKIAIVKQVQRKGLKPKPEISMMIGAGAGTHIVGYKPKLRSFEQFSDEVNQHLKAGAHMLMIESEGLTEDIPPSKWRKDVIMKLTDRFGYEKLMFEASDPPAFKWYLQTFGRDVNLFIDHSQVVEYNVWRLGVWGNPKIWQGRTLHYSK